MDFLVIQIVCKLMMDFFLLGEFNKTVCFDLEECVVLIGSSVKHLLSCVTFEMDNVFRK